MGKQQWGWRGAKEVEVSALAGGGGAGRHPGRRVCVDFVGMQIAGSRLGIDEIGSRETEPQKLEINCRRHKASHYGEAAWPCSTLSQSISYYNHANCGQIRGLTYWYYIPVQPLCYISLLEAGNCT